MATKQPADKSHFILPDLGEGVHEAELIKWCVAVGDTVNEHQTLAEMETDKALVEVPSPWTGVIESLNASEGEIVKVGSKLVNYKADGTTVENKSDTSDAPPDTGCVVGSVDDNMSVPASFQRTSAQVEQTSTQKSVATPAVRRIAKEHNVDINTIEGPGSRLPS